MTDADDLILLVEDDPHQVEFLKRAFAKTGIANPLHVACDGQKAVTFLSDFRHPAPALILLDLKVPRISGLRLLDWMRRRPELRETPVVIITSSIEPEDRRRADELGVVAYLCKPVYVDGVQELMEMMPTHFHRVGDVNS